MVERVAVRKNEDISQDGQWSVYRIDPQRSPDCRYCKGTGVENGEPCDMCEINEWVARFAGEQDAQLFAAVLRGSLAYPKDKPCKDCGSTDGWHSTGCDGLQGVPAFFEEWVCEICDGGPGNYCICTCPGGPTLKGVKGWPNP